LNAAAQAIKDTATVGVDFIALAKSGLLSAEDPELPWEQRDRKEERVFLPGRKNPVMLRQNSSELFLLTQVRDEAHRFGIEFHRKWRRRRTLQSGLDAIEGVGKIRRQKLFQAFGSLKGIKEADLSQLAQVLGGPEALARRVKESL
jgi:excinuclease ABC subunit C